MAQKQKDTRTLKYDPENESYSSLINGFQIWKKTAKFYKEYSEMDLLKFYQEIRWMKSVDEMEALEIEKFQKRQNELKAKYSPYIEYEKWSDSPYVEKTKPYSKKTRILIIAAVIVLFIAILLIIIGLNKWW
ncbi:hypothetical protein [Metamycoplasma cloacale]|nr:hypothetical protein [Metamycoplasma cloacale]